MFKGKRCKRCENKIKDSFDFCPYCGLDLINPERDQKEFGMLGKNNEVRGYPMVGGGGFGITDKIAERVLKNFMKSMPDLMRNLEKQMQDMDPEVQNIPNGIKIRFGPGGMQQRQKQKRPVRKSITQEQIKRMAKLPRAEAKSEVRRFSDKVVYDIKASGIESVDDVFVSKLESGYEVKAIGTKKVYVNSIPVNLPLKGFSLHEKGLKVEFGLQ